MTTDTRTFEAQALELIEKYGFAVFPLKGKVPLTKQGFKNASKDPEQIKEWAKQYPHANVGIATGPASGVVVIDIDRMEALNEMDLPETLTVQTGKGLHYYYKTNGHKITNSAKGMPLGVDVRGEGGYVVAPGSIHPETGRPYSVLMPMDISKLPAHLAKQLKGEGAQAPMGHISNPARYVAKALEAACREIEMCPPGGRNQLLNRKAYLIGRYVGSGLIKEADAKSWLLESALRAGLEEKESARAIANGVKDGCASPKHLQGPANYKPVTLQRKDVADQIIIDCCKSEEMGDAVLFCQLVQGQKLYDHYARVWMTYFNGYWQRDLTHQTTKEAYDLLRSAYADTARRLDKKVSEMRIAPGSEEDKNLIAELKNAERDRDALRDRCKKLGSSKRLHNVLGLAAGMASTLSTEFDADPHLLNLRNGTYDFRKQEFRPHRHQDMMSKISNVYYNPEADCPRWELFLFEICRDDWDLVMYLKKIVGLFLTGRSDYQYLFFFYGNGANGKGTFFQTMYMMLKDFFITLPIDILLTKNKSSADEYHLARLKGARVVMASEIPANRRLNESLVKDLTGNDLVTARNPHEKPFQYQPTHKLCVVGNHKPNIPGTDHGIWRRIRLFPFAHTFPEGQRRPMEEVLAEFREESSGILNWMIDGYRMLLEEGLEMPDAVKLATEEYRMESDSVGVFLDENITSAPSIFSVQLKSIWTLYNRWCEENGERPSVANNRQFAITMREKGFEVRPGAKHQVHVYGIQLIEKGGDGLLS